MARPIITAARLREALHYEPETGNFTWLIKPNRSVMIGDVAGSQDRDGYVCIRICGRSYRAHRLAWLYVHGVLPPSQIDHKDAIRSNNKWPNLRIATNAQNKQNMRKARSDNRVGLLGVFPDRDKWRARITIDSKKVSLGTFETPELAHAAYLAAKHAMHPFQTLVDE